MDQAYWDRIATRYDEEVLSSFHSDRTGVITAHLDSLGGVRKTVLDLGCGVGKYLPALAERFARVVGVDHSEELLRRAEGDHGHLGNVELIQVDAALGRRVPGVQADVVVCANVLITADAALRRGILRTARKCLARGGHLLLVVPSLESALLAHRRLVEWHEREGADDAELAAEEDGLSPSKGVCRGLLRGLVPIDGMPTRHYLAEELPLLLGAAGLGVTRLEKVHYGWDSEFHQPPRWLRAPFPWDWLAVAQAT